MSRNIPVLWIISLLLAIQCTLGRRAVGRREGVVEAAVGARGIADETDEWGEEIKADHEEQEEARGVTKPVTRGSSSPSGRGRRKKNVEQSPEAAAAAATAAAAAGVVEGPVPWSVRERGLVIREEASAASILQEHQSWHVEEDAKNFQGETLGYVTPWNGRGYDFARSFRSKLDYVSPVWYQLRSSIAQSGDGNDVSPGSTASFSLVGGHDFDEAWVSDVRDGVDKPGWADDSKTHVTKIVPRVVLEVNGRVQLSGEDLVVMADLLAQEASLRRYHGYVLDIPMAEGIEEFLLGIKHAAARNGIQDLLIIQSVRPGLKLSSRQLERLVPLVHRFSLMTYDFGVIGRTGGSKGGVPNSPLSWVRESVEEFAPRELGSELRSKVLVGLPFYGYDNGRALNYNDIVSVLEGEQTVNAPDFPAAVDGASPESRRLPAVTWDDWSREHVVTYKGRDMVDHEATYPTLAFVAERAALAEELGVGLSVWELGQGMPYFFDLL